jgi:putative spermidine/putrescine transport system ATP-binding protein
VSERHLLVLGPQGRRLEVPVPVGEGAGAGRSLSSGAQVDVAIRRDDIQLRRAGIDAALPGLSSIAGQLKAIEYQGYFVKVLVDVGTEEEFVVYVPERDFFREGLDVGDAVLASWKNDLSRLLALG